MSQDHRLQQQRFELKYLVDEAITPALRDFVSSYLELDDYGARRPDMSYPVYSVYLDSDGLETYQAAVNGVRNRFKLRLRYYSDDPDGPVFFEVKAREDNCILKQRCGVRREAADGEAAVQQREAEGARRRFAHAEPIYRRNRRKPESPKRKHSFPHFARTSA